MNGLSGFFQIVHTQRMFAGSVEEDKLLSRAHGRGPYNPCTRCVAVWLRPASTFGPLYFTTFIESSHMLAMPSTLAPYRLMLAVYVHASRFGRSRGLGWDTVSERLTRFVTSPRFLVGYC